MSKYDGLYIFTGVAKDEALDKQIEKALAEITRLVGKVIDTVNLGRKTFSHPMHKKDSGVYVRVRFEIDPSKISVLTNRYHLTGDVFRVQFLVVDERREAILTKQARARKAREEARAAKTAAAAEQNTNAEPAPAEAEA